MPNPEPASVHLCTPQRCILQVCVLMIMPSASLHPATLLAWLWARMPIHSPVLAGIHHLQSRPSVKIMHSVAPGLRPLHSISSAESFTYPVLTHGTQRAH